ncbi:MAG: pyruvate:ferredoxin (flavodoxin) oxidoreductase [Bacilli bacterium]
MEVKKKFLSVDGNTAAALASYNYTDVAAIYPITPSSPMAELIDIYASQGKLNFFGSKVKVAELQSEGGASGAVHGSLQAGALATTYTASQGLLLMLPNIYKWVGELLPAVMHVSARSIAARALSIFGDHQDIYAVRQTGITMICSHSVQEVADLANVAHLVAIDASVPVLHFFDGFRTSHEIQNVEFVEDEEWKKLLPLDKVAEFRKRALNPHTNAVTRGGAENDDIYFQAREAQNLHYQNVIEVSEKYFEAASKLTGRKYAPFVYEGAKDATKVIVAMGSITDTVGEVVRDLNSKGEKLGLVKVHLYRPFSAKHLSSVIPSTVKQIAVLDRTKEMGAVGEPLYVDVVSALKLMNREDIEVYGGRYGLSSKDTQPKHIKGVFDFLDNKPWHSFTIGIEDDLTNLSVKPDEDYHIVHDNHACLFYGLGSDGTVSANKSSIKIIGDATGQYAQAYFAYDSRKAGGATRSYLRFGKNPIHSPYYIENAGFISCSLDTYLFKYDMLRNLKDGGTFLLNTELTDEELLNSMPNRVKYQLAKRNARFFVIDANAIAREIGMGRHTNTILQSSFFYLNPSIMDYESAKDWMKKLAKATYGRKGEAVVKKNYDAIDRGADGLREIKVDKEWLKLKPVAEVKLSGDKYFDEFVTPIERLEGNDLPTSMFTNFDLLDGTMQNDVTFKQKRQIADQVPHWISENCIQCNTCSFVCPHATIRPFLLTPEEIEKLPEDVKDDLIPAMGPGLQGYMFRIQVSPANCVGCGLCVVTCPGKRGQKALEMRDTKEEIHLEAAADYLYKEVTYKDNLLPEPLQNAIKGVGFKMPYMEISGACAGCGETPYYRLVSQLFGADMLVANATGCSSIYCGSTPGTPFVTNKEGEGVAWANSLFEDNAEFGFGMRLATDYKLARIAEILEANKADVEEELALLIDDYLANVKDRAHTKAIKDKLITLIENSRNEAIKESLLYKDDFVDKSVWIVGGDGWAYDIGYGGLDHVLASGADVNVLVLDTEVYSNTGGQASKSTQTGAIAKFAASGKTGTKKNLALMAMAYGDVYVAQISLGANPNAAIKALKEAESYEGPSLVIAYSPCVEHGIKGGLSNHNTVEKKAVESGYWNIFRYDPRLEKEGKSPLQLDYNKEPDYSLFREFVMGENRFSQLPKVNPEHAEELLTKSEQEARKRYERIKKFG